nr:oligouridylate-binding protein 1B [Ipomoea batatas]
MQQALLQQQPLYHPGLIAAPPIELFQVESALLDLIQAQCRSGVTETTSAGSFSSTGLVEGCKLIRKGKDFGQPIKVNWAYASNQREDTQVIFNIFVGDLSPEVTDAIDAKGHVGDQKTGRSRGFGFVSFRNHRYGKSKVVSIVSHICFLPLKQKLSQYIVVEEKWLGSRQIRCNWATKVATSNDDKQSSDARSVVELTNDDGKEATNSEAPENNPQYTTVYVGNLAPEACNLSLLLVANFTLCHIVLILHPGSFCLWGPHSLLPQHVTQLDLHRHFHTLGAGAIEEVRVQRDKGFGFVRYSTHAEAALAIQMGNSPSLLCGKQIKCSWGSKPTPPGTASNPLPPPAPAPLPGLSAIDLLAYERQLAMSKMGGVHALMHPQGQHPMKQVSMGMGAAGASQAAAIYDGGFQSVAAAQQLMYYQ